MKKKIIKGGAKWKGITVGRSAIYAAFEHIRKHQGHSQYDMTGDNEIMKVLWELYEIGKATGRQGMKIKYKL